MDDKMLARQLTDMACVITASLTLAQCRATPRPAGRLLAEIAARAPSSHVPPAALAIVHLALGHSQAVLGGGSGGLNPDLHRPRSHAMARSRVLAASPVTSSGTTGTP